MQQSSKIKLLNEINNKLYCVSKTSAFSIIYSKDALKYLEILYKEGLVLSYKRAKNLLKVTVNLYFTSMSDKVLFEKSKNRPSLKYRDLVKIKSSIKTVYFHTDQGFRTLEQMKSKKLGGVPIFYI